MTDDDIEKVIASVITSELAKGTSHDGIARAIREALDAELDKAKDYDIRLSYTNLRVMH